MEVVSRASFTTGSWQHMKFLATSLGRLKKPGFLPEDTANRIPILRSLFSETSAPREVAQGPVEIELDGCTPRMVIERRVDRTIVTIKPVAPARLSDPHTLGSRLVGMMEAEGPKVIFIDLGEIARISSETLNQLIEVNCRARMTGIRLVLSNLNPTLLQVFRVTRLDRLFEIEAAESVV